MTEKEYVGFGRALIEVIKPAGHMGWDKVDGQAFLSIDFPSIAQALMLMNVLENAKAVEEVNP